MAPEFSSDVESGEVELWRGRRLFWGLSTGPNCNLQDAIAAAVNQANLEDRTPLSVVYTEVESEGDPRPGAYGALLSAGGP